MWPYYGLGSGHGGAGVTSAAGNVGEDGVSDALPAGEIGIQRGDHVHALDGDIGDVQGLVVASADHRITHILLQEGHLFGRKVVAIPIGAVTGLVSGVELDLSKRQVQELPSVAVVHPCDLTVR